MLNPILISHACELTDCEIESIVVVDSSVLVAALLHSRPHGTWAECIVAQSAPFVDPFTRFTK